MAYASIWRVAGIGLGSQGEAIVNTFHYGITGVEPTTLMAVDVAQTFQAIWETQIPLLFTSDYTEYGVTAACIKGPNNGKSVFIPYSAPTAGSLPLPSAPYQVAAIGRRYSTALGRHNRGRCFLSPLPATAFDVNGQFTPPAGWVLAWQLIAQVTPAFGGVGYDSILYDTVNKTGALVTTSSYSALAGTMRRRRVRLPN